MKNYNPAKRSVRRVVVLGWMGVLVSGTAGAASVESECREAIYVQYRGEECRAYARNPNQQGNAALHAACRVPNSIWMAMANDIQACTSAGGVKKWQNKK